MMKYILALLCLIVYSCGENKINTENQSNTDSVNLKKNTSATENIENKNITADKNLSKTKFNLKDFYSENAELNKKVEEIFNSMKDDERIAQMIITSTGNNGKPVEHVLSLIKRKRIGGVVFLGGSKEKFKGLISDFTKINEGLPLIYSTDAEPSLINMKISGLKHFEPTGAMNSLVECKNTAKDISEILHDIGFNQNFAPVCDNNLNRDVIGERSFGGNEKKITEYSKIFIDETQNQNIIATAKHFPGHGMAKGDSHKSLVYIDGELKELSVYKELINNKEVISIMVGHIAIKNNKEYDTDNYPATLSNKIVTGLLKDKLQFKGIIITDGMNMGALNSFTTPSFKAVEAGCDMILMPSDEEQLFNSIKEKFNNPNFRNQIYDSIKKIIRAKVCLGIV